MAEFLMPSLGADMEAGTLVEWLKQPGEAVSRGDILAVVETQKGAIEIESFQDGTLDRYLVDVGQKVPVGTPLAVIDGDEAERAAAPAAPAPESSAPPAPAPAEQELREPKPEPALAAGERLRITPAAMHLAEQSGIDPRDAGLTGSGPQGAITLEDVEALLKQGKAAAPKATPAPEGMRAAIAAAMSRSKREIPHYYLSHSVDLTAAQAFVTARNEGRPPEDRLLLGVLYLAAVTRALKKYPEFNGHYTDNAFHPAEVVNAGMAFTIRGGGLVAPAILDAGAMDLDA
ncbi:MAG: 2-oxo acid dehydrogenase subunit E2, partial [Paracoccaceae bacterium]